MSSMKYYVIVFICVFSTCIAHRSYSQQPVVQNSENAEKAESAKHFEYFDALASTFEANLATGEPVQLLSDPLQKWTIDTSWQGSFYIWTCKNRPVLIGCFLSDSEFKDKRRAFAEMHTLVNDAFEPINFNGSRSYQWTPTVANQSVLSLPVLPKPVSGATRQRTQMRQIASDFSVVMNDNEHLRMLTTPIYRYPDTPEGTVVGAIFSFVRTNGTDPEFLLAIELDSNSKVPEWRIRPIRFTTRRLKLLYEESNVWNVNEYDTSSVNTRLTGPYVIVTLQDTSTASFDAKREQIIQNAKVLDRK